MHDQSQSLDIVSQQEFGHHSGRNELLDTAPVLVGRSSPVLQKLLNKGRKTHLFTALLEQTDVKTSAVHETSVFGTTDEHEKA